MIKYVHKNGGKIGTVYHVFKDCTALKDYTPIKTTDNLLKHYGITEMCKVCRQRLSKPPAEKLTPLERRLVSKTSRIVEHLLGRDALREFCDEFELIYNMRSTKADMARSLCTYYIKNGMYRTLLHMCKDDLEHWSERIRVGDRHNPHQFISNRDHCLDTIKELEDKINETRIS